MIEAALAPLRDELRPAELRMPTRALALVVGTAAMVVCKDVLQLEPAEARRVRRWAIRAGRGRTPAAALRRHAGAPERPLSVRHTLYRKLGACPRA